MLAAREDEDRFPALEFLGRHEQTDVGLADQIEHAFGVGRQVGRIGVLPSRDEAVMRLDLAGVPGRMLARRVRCRLESQVDCPR